MTVFELQKYPAQIVLYAPCDMVNIDKILTIILRKWISEVTIPSLFGFARIWRSGLTPLAALIYASFHDKFKYSEIFVCLWSVAKINVWCWTWVPKSTSIFWKYFILKFLLMTSIPWPRFHWFLEVMINLVSWRSWSDQVLAPRSKRSKEIVCI